MLCPHRRASMRSLIAHLRESFIMAAGSPAPHDAAAPSITISQLKKDIQLGPRWLCWDFCRMMPGWHTLFKVGEYSEATEFVVNFMRENGVSGDDEVINVGQVREMALTFKHKAVECMVATRKWHRAYPEVDNATLEMAMISDIDGRHLIPGGGSAHGFGPFGPQTHFEAPFILTQIFVESDEPEVLPALAIDYNILEKGKPAVLRINTDRAELGAFCASRLNKFGLAMQHGAVLVESQLQASTMQ